MKSDLINRGFPSLFAVMGALVLGFGTLVLAQQSTVSPGRGAVIVPESSQIQPSAGGVRGYTNFEVFVPDTLRPAAPPFSGYAFETPASLACLYELVRVTAGCNPNTLTANATGGSKVVAIVDAYDDPMAASDLAYFSEQFGLPFSSSQFTVVFANGSRPAEDPTGGWELEESLDIEYVHAMAPRADIYLVETASNSIPELLTGVEVATNEVRCRRASCTGPATGAGEVSMSWGTPEFSTETSLEKDFTAPNVVYIAATGDSPGTLWPSVSPNVVAAGGTTTARSLVTGDFLKEITWGSGGGGMSLYEPRSTYQSGLPGRQRVVPDLAFDSNPYTGVWVWDSNNFQDLPPGWFIVGGTSLAAQALTGVINASGKFLPSSAYELATIYKNRSNGRDFREITYGTCGPYSGFFATTGWDFCTGVGSPLGTGGK